MENGWIQWLPFWCVFQDISQLFSTAQQNQTADTIGKFVQILKQHLESYEPDLIFWNKNHVRSIATQLLFVLKIYLILSTWMPSLHLKGMGASWMLFFLFRNHDSAQFENNANIVSRTGMFSSETADVIHCNHSCTPCQHTGLYFCLWLSLVLCLHTICDVQL